MTGSREQELLIRQMRLDDLPAVLEIDRLSFPVPWPASSYRFEILENPVSNLLVAERMGAASRRLVGYLGMWELVDEGHISTLAVHPEHRRQGIARALLINALGHFAERGVDSVSLEVRASNEAAQSLYGWFGFEIAGRRAGYYRDNKEDALVMKLEGLGERLRWLEVNRELTS